MSDKHDTTRHATPYGSTRILCCEEFEREVLRTDNDYIQPQLVAAIVQNANILCTRPSFNQKDTWKARKITFVTNVTLISTPTSFSLSIIKKFTFIA
ncbi:uncharacterized protein LODBEIA_P01110 [Lodderomyces beijingensis]|uniref:Uncharacterized protein n=1 Tax=Lodderomyces beijingensis TaxID=1775926 RepID=A0ABP0ZEJ4_9ASCO